MKRLSFIFSFKNLPYTIFVVILIIFVGGQLLVRSTSYWAYLYQNSSPKLDDGLRFAAVAHGIDKNRKKALILGASQARENVDISVLNETFRKDDITFYNLGISQGQTIDFFMTKDLIIDSNPSLIVFVGDLNMLSSPYIFDKLRLYFHPSIIYYWIRDIGWKYVWQNRLTLIHAWIGYVFPLYQYRESIGRIAQNEIGIILTGKKREPFRRFAYSGKRHDSTYEDLEKTINSERSEDMASPSEIAMNKALFENFIETITSRGIKLIMIDAPYFENAKRTYFENVYPDYDRFMRHLSEKYKFPYYSDNDKLTFDRTYFVDHTHLNKDGRVKFTEFLENIILGDNIQP